MSIAPRGTPDEDRARIIPLAADILEMDAASLTLLRRCAVCGGEHGRPQLVLAQGSGVAPPSVSLSRTRDLVAIAVSTSGAVGIDIESISAVAASPVDVFDADELPGGPDGHCARALAWATKEAVLKAAGVGLREDPESVVVRITTGEVHVVAWPRSPVPLADIRIIRLHDLPAGVVGAVAVFQQRPPADRVRNAGLGAG